MTTHPLLETDDQTAGWARSLYGEQIVMLGEVAQAGLAIDQQVVRLAKDAWDVHGVQIAAMAHTRVARAVRITLMLQAKLIKALEDRDAHRQYLFRSRLSDERREKQAQTARIVERVAARERDDAEEVERLVQDAAERLDQDDLYGDILDRPVSELIAMICKDLGLHPDWPKLTEEAWAKKEKAGGAPGWPLAGLTTADSAANLAHGRFRPSG